MFLVITVVPTADLRIVSMKVEHESVHLGCEFDLQFPEVRTMKNFKKK